MRFLVLFSIFFLALSFAKTTVSDQIKDTSKEIRNFDRKYKNLNKKMAKNAKRILRQKRKILQQQEILDNLLRELEKTKKYHQECTTELASLQNQEGILTKEQNKIEQELVFSITRGMSLGLMLNEHNSMNEDGLITEEVLKALSKQTKEDIKKLEKDHSNTNKNILTLKKRSKELTDDIAKIDSERIKVKEIQKSNKILLKDLESKKDEYKASISSLLKQQSELKKTLSDLNIIHQNEIQKAREAEQERLRQAALAAKEEEERKRLTSTKNLPKVRNLGSSYQAIKTKKYRGKKTIAPLTSYTLLRKFGPYTDPIYKIKIFNESVSLQSKKKNAKVRNILNGKVILAKEVPLLNNIVIIEHDGGLHTIYAQLKQIAPNIKKGQRVKKGTVIGRVEDELMFEVTQKNYHIDPMELIK